MCLRPTYATRFSHTARRSAGSFGGAAGGIEIAGGGGRTSGNGREGTLAEPEGFFEVVSDGALNVVDAAGRAGLLREPLAEGVLASLRSSEIIFDGGGLESGWGYE